MIGVVVFVVVIAMPVVALIAGLAVMRDIFFEAVGRVLSGGSDGKAAHDERTGPPEDPVTGEPDADGWRVCEACGTANEPRFAYCRHCTAELR